jgi:1-deoxy-D-xylulose-5-phosphate reductoisomerase
MMNNALEIVEARYLFDVNVEQIAVTVHPQSIVHSMVEFIDGTVMAQMSPADMRLPLRYALSWPQRWSADAPGFSPTTFAQLHFEDPDESKFPALRLGRLAAQRGGTAGSVLNAANEVAVALFMSGKIRFPEIAERVGRALEQHRVVDAPDLEQIMTADREAREEVLR